MNYTKAKEHFGLNVHVEIAHGWVLLTAEPGGSVSDKIYLETGVFQALIDYVERAKQST